MIKNLIIAFLLGMLLMDFAYGMRVPNIALPDSVEPELQETIKKITNILNNGRYVMTVSSAEILTGDELDEGEFLMDASSVTKYLVVSDGSTNYRVQLTAI